MFPEEQNRPQLRTTDLNNQINTVVCVRAPFSITRFAYPCRTRSGFSWFCYSHPPCTAQAQDSSLSLETRLWTVFLCLCQGPPAPPQAGVWPELPWPGWVGIAGVMSLCLPRKGGTKDGVPKDRQPHPQRGHGVDFSPSFPSFRPQKCLLFTK